MGTIRSKPAPAALAAALAAATFLAGCDGAGTAGTPSAILDAHIHTDFTGEPEPASGIPVTREELLRQMREAGVVGAVAHTDTSGGGDVDLSGHGIIHCGGVRVPADTARLAGGLRSGRYRCIKIYLGYVRAHATDPAYEPAYALAATYDVPVVFHTGDTYSPRGMLKYSHPLAIDEVAVTHPHVTFVIAHAGYPWIRTAAEITYKNPNVYLEASAFMLGSAEDAGGEWVERYVVRDIAWIFGYIEDPSKMMFGSDWPLVEMKTYVEAYKRAIPREHWRAVFHDNAARVFRLHRDAPPAGGP
ncbi:MAG: amidohydrolase family protein [Gemmatimonadota bacterium]